VPLLDEDVEGLGRQPLSRPRTVARNVAVAIFAVVAAIELHSLIFMAYSGIDFERYHESAAFQSLRDKLGPFSLLLLTVVRFGFVPFPISPLPLAIVLFGAWITLRRGDPQAALLALLASSVLVLIEPILVYLIF